MPDYEDNPTENGMPERSSKTYSRPKSDDEYSESFSSSSLQRVSSSRSRPKKRKAGRVSDLQHQVKRLKPSYNDKYRELFNTTVNDTTSGGIFEEDPLPPSQIGLTMWSSEEKTRFFTTLTRRGHHDLKAIAANVGSKSESEVCTYLHLLQSATADKKAHGHRKNLLEIGGMESALEISQGCCTALDLAAEALSVLRQRDEEKLEKQEHADFSLLTASIGIWANRSLHAGEEGEQAVLKAIPAATLLDLKTFLTLSKRFFMNSSILENNWRNYTEKRKSPSITYTAFSDMYTLAISLTRRLIQSSVFFAMSRLRAMDTSGRYTSKQHVRRRDVTAAVSVLGMEANGRKVWIGTARKCRLHVYENVRHRQVQGKRYSYGEVEAILSKDGLGSRGRYRTSSLDDKDVTTQDGESIKPSSEDDSEEPTSPTPLSTEESGSSLSEDAGPLALPSSHGGKYARKQQRREEAEDAYLEVLDQRASREEEKRLWQMLGEDAKAKKVLDENEFPDVPVPRRADREEHKDWTAWIDYAASWENFAMPVPANSFAENRRLGKSRDSASGLKDLESSSQDSGSNESAKEALSDGSLRGSSSDAQSSELEHDSGSGRLGDSEGDGQLRYTSGQGNSVEVEGMEASLGASSSKQDSSLDRRGRQSVDTEELEEEESEHASE